MAGFQPLRRPIGVFDDSDDIDDWMARRNAEVARRPDAEAAGREAWNQATRSGQNLGAARPNDLVRLGVQSLSGDTTADGDPVRPISPDGPLLTPPRVGFSAARPGDSISKLIGTSDPAAIGRFLNLNGMGGRGSAIYPGQTYVVPTGVDDATPDEIATGSRSLQQDNRRLAAAKAQRTASRAADELWAQRLNAGLNPWTGEPDSSRPAPPTAAPRATPRPRNWLDDSRDAKKLAGSAAQMAGEAYGVFRAGEHAVEGLGTVARLFSPLDPILSPPGEAAWDQVTQGGRRLVSGVRRRVADPNLVAGDLRRINVALNPDATPMADRFGDELGRRFHIGANRGEFVANVAAIPLGGEAGSALEGMEYAGEADDVGKYLKTGFTEGQAAELAKPYVGLGHHVVAQRTTLPGILGGGPVPSAISNSRLFRLMPEGIDKGQFYGLHYGVDDHFYGAKIAGYGKGRGFSGKKLGLPRYQGLERAWRGTTGYAKGVAGGALADLGDDVDRASH